MTCVDLSFTGKGSKAETALFQQVRQSLYKGAVRSRATLHCGWEGMGKCRSRQTRAAQPGRVHWVGPTPVCAYRRASIRVNRIPRLGARR
jgi:hypothetical protein